MAQFNARCEQYSAEKLEAWGAANWYGPAIVAELRDSNPRRNVRQLSDPTEYLPDFAKVAPPRAAVPPQTEDQISAGFSILVAVSKDAAERQKAAQSAYSDISRYGSAPKTE